MVEVTSWYGPTNDMDSLPEFTVSPSFMEKEAERREFAKEKATMELYPPAAAVKQSAREAENWLSYLASGQKGKVDEQTARVAAVAKGLQTIGELPGNIAIGAVKAVPRIIKGAAEVAAASPYAMAKGVGRVTDTFTKVAGDVIGIKALQEKGLGLEEQIDKSYDESAVGKWLKQKGKESPVATDMIADLPAYMLAGGIVGKGVSIAGKGAGYLTNMLASSKYAKFANGLKNFVNTPFVQGMMNPKNLADTVRNGSMSMYAGRYASTLMQNVAADALTYPQWLSRQMKERSQKEYLTTRGLLTTALAWDAGFSIFGIVPLRHELGQRQIAFNFTQEGAYGRLLESGKHTYKGEELNLYTQHIQNKMSNFLAQLRFYKDAKKLDPKTIAKRTDKVSINASEMAGAENKLRYTLGKLLKLNKSNEIVLDSNFIGELDRIYMSTNAEGKTKYWLSETLENIEKEQPVNKAKGETGSYVKEALDRGDITFLKNAEGKPYDVVVNNPAVDIEILRPKRRGEISVRAGDIRILYPTTTKGGVTKAHASIEDRIASSIIEKKNALSQSVESNELMRTRKPVLDTAGNALVDAEGKIITEENPDSLNTILGGLLEGGMPDELATFWLERFGKHMDLPLHSAGRFGLLQSIKHMTQYEGESKVFVKLAERTSKAIRTLEGTIVTKKMPTWNRIMSSGDAKSIEIANDFFRLYSPMRNKGYKLSGFKVDDYGNGLQRMRAELDIFDSTTRSRFCKETGIDPEVISGILDGEIEIPKRFVGIIEDAGKEGMKFYVPAMDNKMVSAEITNNDAIQLMKEWAGVQDDLYGLLMHSEKILNTGHSYKRYHTQTADEDIRDLWFVKGFKEAGAEEETLASFRSRADAERGTAILTKNGFTVTRLQTGIDEVGLAKDKVAQSRIIAGYHQGPASGHWQGDLYDTGIEGLAEIYQGTLEEGRNAIRCNVENALTPFMDRVRDAGYVEWYQDYEKLIKGQLPKDIRNVKGEPVSIDAVFKDNMDKLWRAARKPRDIPAESLKNLTNIIYEAAPIKLRSKGKNFITNISKDISLAMYSGFNASAAVTNVLSILQATPMAMQWYNKFPAETKQEWLERTGIKLAQGEEASIVSDTYLGLQAIRRMSSKEGMQELFTMAEKAGVLTNELKVLQQALDPLHITPKAGILGAVKKAIRGTEKALEYGSQPVLKTEEWSRLAAFAVGYEVATKRFKMAGEAAISWASGFVETAQGGYGLFSRPGYSNSELLKHLFMFTTYSNNIITRHLDMYVGGDKLGLLKADLLSAVLFGPKTTPFMKQWMRAHGKETDFELSAEADMGLSARTGLAFNSMVDFDVASVLRGVERPIALDVLMSCKNMIADVLGDIAAADGEGVSMQYVMEAASTQAPGIFARRGSQFLLGYKTTMNHNLLTEIKKDIHDDIMQRAKLLAGIPDVENRTFANYARYQERIEDAKREGQQQWNKSMLVAARNDNKERINALLKDGLRLYGYDANILAQHLIDVLQNSKADLRNRLIMELLDKDEWNFIGLTVLQAMQRNEKNLAR